MGHSSMKSRFALAGRFVRFAIEDGYKIKGFYFEVAGEVLLIKLPKRLRFYCADLLMPGAMLQIVGQKKVKRKEERVKYTAEEIIAIASVPRSDTRLQVGHSVKVPVSSEIVSQKKDGDRSKPACIKLCQKKSCCKRGGDAVWAALEREITDRDLGDRVVLKGTGCMDKCKAGPNIIMPGKMRYSRIDAKAIPGIMEEHFTPVGDLPS